MRPWPAAPPSRCPGMTELTLKRVDGDAFPFFRTGQYVALQSKVGKDLVSRPYSIVSSSRQALENVLVLGVADAGFEQSKKCIIQITPLKGLFFHCILGPRKQVIQLF